MAPTAPLRKTHVTRSLRPGQPGTIKLRRIHGPALLCVRYRENEAGTLRYTTIELVIDTRPMRRHNPQTSPMVRISLQESNQELRRQLIAKGAEWDGGSKTWTLTLAAARALKVLPRK